MLDVTTRRLDSFRNGRIITCDSVVRVIRVCFCWIYYFGGTTYTSANSCKYHQFVWLFGDRTHGLAIVYLLTFRRFGACRLSQMMQNPIGAPHPGDRRASQKPCFFCLTIFLLPANRSRQQKTEFLLPSTEKALFLERYAERRVWAD